MLRRDSDVARKVRKYLLDAEEASRVGAGEVVSLQRRVTNVEAAVGDIGAVLQELGPVIRRMSVRLEGMDRRVEEMDRRLTGTGQVVAAMSHRLTEVGGDVRELRAGLDAVTRRRRPRRG